MILFGNVLKKNKKMKTIDKERIKINYNEDFISNICEINHKYIEFLNENHPRDLYRQTWAIPFFRQFGNLENIYEHFYTRNNSEIPSDLYVHMKNTLYSPNLGVLDYVIENYELFKDFKFFDFACGSGILSVFLNKLNIQCYNYDTNTEIGMKGENDIDDFSEFTFTNFYNKLTGNNLKTISDKKYNDYDVLVCCGYYLDHSFIIETAKYLFLDNRYNSGFNNINFTLIDSYSNDLNIYKRNNI